MREPGHGNHEGHDHDAHEGHDHDAHEGHDHGSHEGHDHGSHEGHDHGSHEGHDHGSHEGHDHGSHEGHDHGSHEGHDHDAHEGHDHGSHGHAGHDHAHDLRGASKRRLKISLVMISTYMVAEAVGGFLSGSLALIADAGHMLTDAAAIALALGAIAIADRAATAGRTYGLQRAEVLAALVNVLALWAIAIWILFEAYQRAFSETVEVDGIPVLLVGLGGLGVNIAAAYILHSSSQHSMNVEGAFQHVIADILGSVGVIVSAIAILAFEWHIVDPILGAGIAFLIAFNSRGLFRQVFAVLLESVPAHIDVYKLCSDIEKIRGVTVIHDVHVWTITSGSEAFTAHVLVDPEWTDTRGILEEVKSLVHERYGIEHVTIQLDSTAASCRAENHHVEHLLAESRTG